MSPGRSLTSEQKLDHETPCCSTISGMGSSPEFNHKVHTAPTPHLALDGGLVSRSGFSIEEQAAGIGALALFIAGCAPTAPNLKAKRPPERTA